MNKTALDRDKKTQLKWKKQMEKFAQNQQNFQQMNLSNPFLRGGRLDPTMQVLHHFAPEKMKFPKMIASKARNPMDYHPLVHFADPFQEPISVYHDFAKKGMLSAHKKRKRIQDRMKQVYGETKDEDSSEDEERFKRKGKGIQDIDQEVDQEVDQEAVQEALQEANVSTQINPINFPIIRNRGGIVCSSDHQCTQPHKFSGEGARVLLNPNSPETINQWIQFAPSMEGVKEAFEMKGAGVPQEVNGAPPQADSNGGKVIKKHLGLSFQSLPEGTWMPFKALRKIPRSLRSVHMNIPRVQMDIRGNPKFLKQENNWEGALRYYRMIPTRPVRYGGIGLIGGYLRETSPIFPG